MSRGPATALVSLLVALLVAATGCGYHLVGTHAQLPAGISSISIPVIANRTTHAEIDSPITQAFRKTLEGLGIPLAASGTADAVLEVTITFYDTKALSYDQNQTVKEYRLTMKADLKLVQAGKTEPVRKAAAVTVTESYAAAATQDGTESNRIEAIDEAASRLASDALDRLLSGF